MDSFEDPRIYVAGEFGIGLNTLSQCLGNCYIEDESTFSTFHIGMGRNLALGGIQDAAGHFDLVFHRPTIYADQTLIMEKRHSCRLNLSSFKQKRRCKMKVVVPVSSHLVKKK